MGKSSRATALRPPMSPSRCHLGNRKTNPTGSPASGPLNHVPLIITVLGDGPVLEWLHRCGFPPWSLAFIPSQRKGGGNTLESKSHQWTTRRGTKLGFDGRHCPGPCAPHNLRSYPLVGRCRSRKVFIMETDAVDRFHAQCASMRCSSSSPRIET